MKRIGASAFLNYLYTCLLHLIVVGWTIENPEAILEIDLVSEVLVE
jgi:hypothetical protein